MLLLSVPVCSSSPVFLMAGCFKSCIRTRWCLLSCKRTDQVAIMGQKGWRQHRFCYLWAWGQCPLRGCGCSYLCHLTHTNQLWYITLLYHCAFQTVGKSGPSLLWTTHYCFHHKAESDSRGQLVIHYKNMEAYHQKQKHASLSSTTRKIGKEKISLCLHVFIDLILIWTFIRLQNT